MYTLCSDFDTKADQVGSRISMQRFLGRACFLQTGPRTFVVENNRNGAVAESPQPCQKGTADGVEFWSQR